MGSISGIRERVRDNGLQLTGLDYSLLHPGLVRWSGRLFLLFWWPLSVRLLGLQKSDEQNHTRSAKCAARPDGRPSKIGKDGSLRFSHWHSQRPRRRAAAGSAGNRVLLPVVVDDCRPTRGEQSNRSNYRSRLGSRLLPAARDGGLPQLATGLVRLS